MASEEDLSARPSGLLLQCARDCRESCDVASLEFGQRDAAALTGAVKRARALLAFSPQYRFRNRLAVDYVPGARCPMFEDILSRAPSRIQAVIAWRSGKGRGQPL